ncbi:MAG TPA: hypothetical protein VH590_04890 [Ktedonobacterales bacterium]|jgi:hypothetical protein
MSQVTGNAARPLSRALVATPRLTTPERVGSVVGSLGSALAVVGFALPIVSGPYQGDGYSVFLLLVLMQGNGPTTTSPGGLGWALVPLILWLLAAVLAGPISLSLMAEPATRRFPRLSLGVFIIGSLLLGDVIGATFCLAAVVFGPVLFISLVLLSFRNPTRGHPRMYALAPLVGLLAYGGGMALYLANGVHWRLGSDASVGGLASANLLGVGFWLCAVGWLLSALGGTLLWRLALHSAAPPAGE